LKLNHSIKNSGKYAIYINQCREHLKNLVEDIIRFGFPPMNTAQNSNLISITQQQSTNLDINVNLFKELFSESQLKELKELIKDKKLDENTKPKIMEKIKEFGIDFTSKFITELITRQEIWGKVFS
jgi:hypothetical protein